MVILLLGLNCNIFDTKSIAYDGVSGLNHYRIARPRDKLTDFIMVYAQSAYKDSMSACEGCPVNAKIFYSWLRVEFPGKKGFPIKISTKIHPILQTSAAVP